MTAGPYGSRLNILRGPRYLDAAFTAYTVRHGDGCRNLCTASFLALPCLS
jgi:hypothetical protein